MTHKQGDTRITRQKSSTWQVQTALAVIAAMTGFVVVAAVLPPGLVLPVFSAAALLAGAGLALYGWLYGVRRQPHGLTCWDYASTCVFLGFAAGTLGDPDHVVMISSTLSNF
jgi:hypothetical protein